MMKRRHLLMLAGLALTSVSMTASTTKLIDALVRVESRGNASAIGDNGKAYGILQIHQSTVADANRIAGTQFTHAEMFDPTKARAVAQIVLNHYSAHILKTTGRTATSKELAFIWNGGGDAWKRATTPRGDSKQRNLNTYWNRVSKAL